MSAASVTVRAPAKINLHLGVGRPREDGFHPLATVYQAVGLYDDVTATDAEEWSVHTIADAHLDLASVPDDGDNIAIRAGRLLAAHHSIARAAHLEIHKGIPVAGGMAGGSADAAATLVALDRLWSLDTSDDDLLALAARLGSDVPFALLGGTALGAGRGELVTPVEDRTALWWVVVPHEIGLPTPLVYRRFDELASYDPAAGATNSYDVPAGLIDALAAGDVPGVAAALGNDLMRPAYDLRPDLAARHRDLATLGTVLLSGSGPTQLVLAETAEAARRIAVELTERGLPHWLAPAPVAGCHVL
ncbi:4-(cytidine 5'-diphospho)-2-C-methyl-D-erythritol kinase [Nocardioides sp.]|uniref:4-(cytidine 5'-diphospho)-2-C-methyl-D-erythritol kinase n=1 Tax=Nocardioides sp. TaxID=35761 RepID=UPI0039E66A4C